ncbi:putative holin-like toxin [Brochothrix thermosphacta]
MFGFGIFIISLLTLVVVLIKFDKKNQIEFDISKNYNACNFQ